MAVKSCATPDIEIALVGLGHIADHQLAAIEMTKGLRVVAACDKNPDTARRLSKDVSFYASIDDLIVAKRFDIAVISTPNHAHFQHGELFINAGKDVILEKPAVETRKQLHDIVLQSQRAGTFLYFSLHAAFGAEVLWFRQQLVNGNLRLGNLRRFHARFYDPYIRENKLVIGAESLGGSWMDSGMNALSVLGHFVKPIGLRVEKSQMRAPEKFGCSETEAKVFVASDGAHGLIHTSWLTGKNHKSTRLIFDQDEILLDHSLQTAAIGRGSTQKILFSYNGSLHRLTNHYVGVFSDLVARYTCGQSNLDYAVALHEPFFVADENRQWEFNSKTCREDLRPEKPNTAK